MPNNASRNDISSPKDAQEREPTTPASEAARDRGATPATPELTILSEFDAIVHPLPDATGVTDSDLADKIRRRKEVFAANAAAQYELTVERVEARGHVAPFEVWVRTVDGKTEHVIVDGRHAEYRAARQLGLPIETLAIEFRDLAQARGYLSGQIASNKGLPPYTLAYRIWTASDCKHITEIQTIGKEHQKQKGTFGARAKDVRPITPVNTRKAIAAMVGCGENTVGYVLKIKKDGPTTFENWEDKKHALLFEGKAPTALHQQLEQKLKQQRDIADEVLDDERERNKGGGKRGSADTPAPIVKTYTNPDLSETFEDQIACGDAAEMLGPLPDASLDLAMGSPHYNVELKYDGRSFNKSLEEYLSKDIEPVAIALSKKLKPGRRWIINIRSIREAKKSGELATWTPLHFEVYNHIKSLNIGFEFCYERIWSKFHSAPDALKNKLGHKVRPGLILQHEHLLVFSLGPPAKLKPSKKAIVDLTQDEASRYAGSIWNIVPVGGRKLDHPCPYPAELVKRCVKLYTRVGELVCDPWNGSGTTTATAASLGRHWFGIDIIEKYCRQANERTLKAHRDLLSHCKKNTTKKPDTATSTRTRRAGSAKSEMIDIVAMMSGPEDNDEARGQSAKERTAQAAQDTNTTEAPPIEAAISRAMGIEGSPSTHDEHNSELATTGGGA